MKPLWTPKPEIIATSNLTQYMNWLGAEKSLFFDDYHSLWQWSVNEVADFWESIVQFYNIDITYTSVISGEMPHAQWFEGAELNYAEYVFKQANTIFPALIFKAENKDLQEVSWETLYQQVTIVSNYLRASGIKAGDCVVGYLPNSPQAIIAFLATVSVGAVWSSASPDFGTSSVIERFGQIKPKILFAVDSYQYGGKVFDKTADVQTICQAIASIQQTVLADNSTYKYRLSNIDYQNQELIFEQVPFNHPIWVVYSSGTTGMPKAITHSQGGVLLEYFKSHGLHNDLKQGDRYFWFSTTGWIMWNIAQGSLLSGATLVLFDGNPNYPNAETLWKLASEAKITHFGTGAAFILASMKAEIIPKKYDLSSLKVIGSTGSPLPVEGFEWIYEKVNSAALLASLSGGTDVAAGFVGGCPHLSLHTGEIQCRMLGCSVQAWDENEKSVIDEVGELVITKPMPNMPIYFWNDTDFSKYTSSYFDVYKNIWRHGDWVKITKNGSVIISGRSDATLNKFGIRIGTSEIYRVVEQIEQIQDSLILNIDYENGTSFMPLFVQMKQGNVLDENTKQKIRQKLKIECSPRYVPDDIIEVSEIPYTMSGKKMEVPIKKILMGVSPEKAITFGAMRNPAAVELFLLFYNKLQNAKNRS